MALLEAFEALFEDVKPPLLHGAHARGIVGHVFAQIGDLGHEAVLVGADDVGRVAALLVGEVEVRFEQALDFRQVALQEALRGVAELPVVALDVFLEAPQIDVALLVFAAEFAPELFLSGRLIALGNLAGLDGALEALVARDGPEEEQFGGGGEEQDDVRHPRQIRPGEHGAERDEHRRDEEREVPGMQKRFLRVVDVDLVHAACYD